MLSRVRLGPGAPAIAVLLDTGSFARLSARARAEADSDLGAARDILAVAGWRVAVADRGSDLAEVWSGLGSAPVFDGPPRVGQPATEGAGWPR